MAYNIDAQTSDLSLYRRDIMEKCSCRLESTNGPVVYKSGEIQEYHPKIGVRISEERPCIIEIRNDARKSSTNGLGCYYGDGHVLTALHVIKNTRSGKSQILVAFSTEETMLVYKAVFTKSCNSDSDRDQAFMKLLGDTSPLGDGLQNQIGKANEIGTVYFYTFSPGGVVLKQEGQISRPHSNMKAQMCMNDFIISVAGKPGDSGSPVYNIEGELIGIYRGRFTRPGYEYGRCSEISPQFHPCSKLNLVHH